jgi:DNA-binding MarR family transcriptional regulator
MTRANDPDLVVIPALLRASRGAYAQAIRNQLAAAGFEDIPRNAPYVLGGLANHGGSLSTLSKELATSKQAASQLIDTLVIRGYLSREINPDDRRRMTIELTERGRAAAGAVQAGVSAVDDELAQLCRPDEIAGLRAGLQALCEIGDRLQPSSEQRPPAARHVMM